MPTGTAGVDATANDCGTPGVSVNDDGVTVKPAGCAIVIATGDENPPLGTAVSEPFTVCPAAIVVDSGCSVSVYVAGATTVTLIGVVRVPLIPAAVALNEPE
jgi:hypothetical protein